MEKKKRKIFFIVVILVIFIIILFLTKKDTKKNFQEELIFFKLFSSGKEESQNISLSKKQIHSLKKSYHLKVAYKNIDFKKINLMDTLSKNTLIREKIAPRNEGEF